MVMGIMAMLSTPVGATNLLGWAISFSSGKIYKLIYYVYINIFINTYDFDQY